jgi:hypothetical protein
MPHIAFIAPHFLDNTNRYLKAFADLPITLSVISNDPESSIPPSMRHRIAGHYKVTNTLDAAQLTVAARAIVKSIGRVDRLVGFLEELQLPMAEVRDAIPPRRRARSRAPPGRPRPSPSRAGSRPRRTSTGRPRRRRPGSTS